MKNVVCKNTLISDTKLDFFSYLLKKLYFEKKL